MFQNQRWFTGLGFSRCTMVVCEGDGKGLCVVVHSLGSCFCSAGTRSQGGAGEV